MFPSDHPDSNDALLTDDSSSGRLEDVGSSAILDAMFEQKRRSSTPPELEANDEDAVATQRLARIAPEDDVFQKIR